MELVLQSVNYHDCPIGRREKVSLANGQQQEMLRALDLVNKMFLLDEEQPK
jgi:aminoglycoside phosphotransferase